MSLLIPVSYTENKTISGLLFGIVFRGVTEQSTLAERGEFHENSTPILRVDYSCIYNNL